MNKHFIIILQLKFKGKLILLLILYENYLIFIANVKWLFELTIMSIFKCLFLLRTTYSFPFVELNKSLQYES